MNLYKNDTSVKYCRLFVRDSQFIHVVHKSQRLSESATKVSKAFKERYKSLKHFQKALKWRFVLYCTRNDLEVR